MHVIDRIVYGEHHITVYLATNEKFNLFYGGELIKGLSSKAEITKEQYENLFIEDRKFKCRSKAFKYISIRNRSQFEMEQYLKKKEFEEKIINETVEYLYKRDLLDDYKFAVQFVISKMRGKPRGKNLILKDLYKRGIDRKISDKAIDECDANVVDLEMVYEFAFKKYEKVKEKKNPLQKVAYFLSQRGFDSGTVFKILDKLKKNS